ncbi:EAL domain-containing protein [Alkalibacter mobilis]|uniref:EAL domain-containing protein n=1 Tax=Alkalibacter mobilis TaxID=2787712 RepID=UPI00189E7CB1|nr:EAL domain-containing protein [Alkalibacter mobilis]MBF7096239.1 EAL domain-containing protein [Alkalibacter mobilis]
MSRKKYKKKAIDFKIFLIAFLVMAVIFSIISYGSVRVQIRENEERLKENTIMIATSYTHTLSKADKARVIINELMNERLKAAGDYAALFEGNHDNQTLNNLTKVLGVDVIYSYNDQGEVIHSSSGEFIGWTAYEGHPVNRFLTGDQESIVEDIRKDSETGIFYKYAYFRAEDNTFVQVGIYANKIQDFLKSFEIQKLIDEINMDGLIVEACFIDNENTVIASSDNDIIGQKVVDEKIIKAIETDREYGAKIDFKGEEMYQVFLPVYMESAKIGTLSVGQSTERNKEIISEIIIEGILSFLGFILVLGFILFFTYAKNSKQLKLAYYDSLTGLPNREYLKDFLIHKIHGDKNVKKAILMINCSDFKNVNLTYGYAHGDSILREITRRLEQILKPTDMLFRFSADRFILYVEKYQNRKNIETLIAKINDKFKKPFNVTEKSQHINIRIGVLEIEDGISSVDEILKEVSITLDYTDENNERNHAYFDYYMEDNVNREDLIEREMRRILAEGSDEVYLEFQPQISAIDNSIVGFEALARLKTDRLGRISPEEFIIVAERKFIIVELGNHIFKKACIFLKKLNERGFEKIKLSVNISGIQLLRHDFIDTIIDITERTGVKTSSIVLEITETIILENYEIINEKLKMLVDHGFNISLDDFGTGYSNFSRLSELSIQEVKIDRYFVSRITTLSKEKLITGDIISMAHKLDLRVVAEGVEDSIQLDYLREHECDVLQGYYFGKPVDSQKALEIIEKSRR